MLPKEKAKELFEQFKRFDHPLEIENAKQCALIAVDEIIENIKEWDFMNDNGEHHFWFWQKVKEEIKKL